MRFGEHKDDAANASGRPGVQGHADADAEDIAELRPLPRHDTQAVPAPESGVLPDSPDSWFTPARQRRSERPEQAGTTKSSWFDPPSRSEQEREGYSPLRGQPSPVRADRHRARWDRLRQNSSGPDRDRAGITDEGFTDLPFGRSKPDPEETIAGQGRPLAPDGTVTRTDMAALGDTAPQKGRGDSRADPWAEVTRGGMPIGSARPTIGGILKSTQVPAGPPSAFHRTETGAFLWLRDTGALLKDTNAMRLIMDTNAMRAIMDTAAMQALRDRLAGKSKTVASVVIAFWVIMAIVICVMAFVPHGGGAAKVSAHRTAGATTALATRPASGVPIADASTPSGKAEVLPVASAVAFGPHGISDGDNPGRAGYVIEVDAPSYWQTEWYRTAHFGMLKSGTGLMLDMGRTVTVSGVELKLAPGSADIEIRVGNIKSSLLLAATRTSAGGTVYADFAKPATGRYVQIWFTALPRDAAGTYQETVYNVRISGRAA